MIYSRCERCGTRGALTGPSPVLAWLPGKKPANSQVDMDEVVCRPCLLDEMTRMVQERGR